MSQIRSRYRFALIVPLVLWSCATPTRHNPRFDVDAAARAVLASNPQPADFNPLDGDEQYVKTSTIGADTYGWIEPHKNAHTGNQLTDLKLLARVRVDRNYRNIKRNVWHYMVVVDTSTAKTGKWNILYVAADGSNNVLGEFSTAQVHTHDRARARWRNHSLAVAWASCTATTCCCEGPRCNEARTVE